MSLKILNETKLDALKQPIRLFKSFAISNYIPSREVNALTYLSVCSSKITVVLKVLIFRLISTFIKKSFMIGLRCNF